MGGSVPCTSLHVISWRTLQQARLELDFLYVSINKKPLSSSVTIVKVKWSIFSRRSLTEYGSFFSSFFLLGRRLCHTYIFSYHEKMTSYIYNTLNISGFLY